MAARCLKCESELTPERQIVLIEMGIPIEKWICVDCSPKDKVYGFMCESSGDTGDMRNIGRKGGYVLQTISPLDPNYKENLRRAMRVHKRSR